MNQHRLIARSSVEKTPCQALPDGMIAGNGDVTVTLGGAADRVLLYIAKADFWKGDGRAYVEHRGGLSPLCTAEILLPHLAYAEYEVVQDMTNAQINLSLTSGRFFANLTITVCAVENTILVELERSHPAVSSSISLKATNGNEAVCEEGTDCDVSYAIRSFDSADHHFTTHGICAMRQVSRIVSEGRERIVWAISVCTNHDSAAYRHQAIERARVIDETSCKTLLTKHAAWWTEFWNKSGVELADKTLELYWYAGLYAVACCARNKKFPPGLWGAYSTADSMGWFGDYHLNYNYEAPFYALTYSNHCELLECYSSPINDFLPTAKRYAKEYLGVRGSYYPVGIGPLGMETNYKPDTKEHGHLFLGQKSNGAYAAVVPVMHWFSTRDKVFAKREYYDFLLSVGEFWEDYLELEDGIYQDYNDALHEVKWWSGPDHMPETQDDNNPIISACLIRMLMKALIDLSVELGENTDKIEKWQDILGRLPAIGTYEANGAPYLRCKDDAEYLDELIMECVYPIGQIGKYMTPEIYEAARNSHKSLAIWDSNNRFCSFYPAAARLGFSAEEIIGHIYDTIKKRGMPNGMFRYSGGGLENSSAIPSTVNEMLLQSYEDVLRLFPVWDKSHDAKFYGLRAKGAFIVNATLENGKISAEILSEQGMPLTLEIPAGGCTLTFSDGRKLAVSDPMITIETSKSERITLLTE